MAKPNLPLIEKLQIVDIASDGKAVGKDGERVIFVPKLVPGDVVDVQLIRKKKSFFEGVPVKFHDYSEFRTEPFCKHFGSCGGCKWQNMLYEKQLYFKEKQVKEQLQRIGNLDFPGPEPILASGKIKYYRNKLEYSFSDKAWFEKEDIDSGKKFEVTKALGFHVPGRFDKVLQVDHCYLQAEPTNAVRNAIHTYAVKHELSYYNPREHTGLLRNLIIRITRKGEVMVVLVVSEFSEEVKALLEHIKASFPEINSLMYIVNNKKNDSIFDLDVTLFAGNPYIRENLDGLDFKIGAKSFFQTNTWQTEVLYQQVREMAGINNTHIVYDLYSGTGSLSLYLARDARKVIGVEIVEDAVRDARLNAEINGLNNLDFFTGDMKEVVTSPFISQHGRPDVLVLDPPRAGIHKNVIKVILQVSPEKIIYVSCNPATQARDLSLMKDNYDIGQVQPVDMFPHTQHVENIVMLEKKK
ncbi:MAG: 23S rRNA (uracil(1939)-C(5))-methyltransferase RlmD [Bacteroidales bacterium]